MNQLVIKSDPAKPEAISLGGLVNFDTVNEGLETLSGLMTGSKPGGSGFTLDLAGVTKSNSAALALLVECKAIAKRQGVQLQFLNVPQGVWQLAEVCEAEALIR